MKKVLTVALATAAALGAASSAMALNAPQTNNGDLVLFVSNSANPNQFYERDLGIRMSDIVTPSTFGTTAGLTLASGSTFTMNASGVAGLNIGPDGNLTSFLTNPANSGQFTYTVMAANIASTGTKFSPLKQDALIATSANLITGVQPTNSQVQSMVTGLTALEGDAAIAALTSGQSAIGPTGYGGGANGNTAPIYFAANVANGGNLGAALSLYVDVTNGASGGAGAPANIYLANQTLALKLDSSGNLSFTAGSGAPVPLPAAVWLLGSGLVGLAGVGRRRTKQAVVAA